MSQRLGDINAVLRYDILMKLRTPGEKRVVVERAPKFVLWNQNGKKITHEDLMAKVIIMNFIYTRCPRLARSPLAKRLMAELKKQVNDSTFPNILFVTISFDPLHGTGTPIALKACSISYGINDENFYFLTGDDKVVSSLMCQFGIYTARRTSKIEYTMRIVVFKRGRYTIYAESDTAWSVEGFYKRVRRISLR